MSRRIDTCEQDGHDWTVDETMTDDGIDVFTHCSVCGTEWSE